MPPLEIIDKVPSSSLKATLTMIKLSAEQLLLLYGQGDPKAFSALFKRYHRLIFGYLLLEVQNRVHAERLLMLVFARIHAHIIAFKPTRLALDWLFEHAHSALHTKKNFPFKNAHLNSAKAQLSTSQLAEVREDLTHELEMLQRSERVLLEERYFHSTISHIVPADLHANLDPS